jgi:hypothetical protein
MRRSLQGAKVIKHFFFFITEAAARKSSSFCPLASFFLVGQMLSTKALKEGLLQGKP